MNRMKDKLRRFIAMIMCAVICAGMAPEALLGAFAEEVKEEAGNTGITIQYTYPEDAIDTSAEAPIVFEADEEVNYFYFNPSSDINSEFVYLMRVVLDDYDGINAVAPENYSIMEYWSDYDGYYSYLGSNVATKMLVFAITKDDYDENVVEGGETTDLSAAFAKALEGSVLYVRFEKFRTYKLHAYDGSDINVCGFNMSEYGEHEIPDYGGNYDESYIWLQIPESATRADIVKEIKRKLKLPAYDDNLDRVAWTGYKPDSSCLVEEFEGKALDGVPEETELHIKWTVASDVNMTFKLNGGKLISFVYNEDEETVEYDEENDQYTYSAAYHYPFGFPHMGKEGYVFGGWKMIESGAVADPTCECWLADNVNWEAVWLEPVTDVSFTVSGLNPEVGGTIPTEESVIISDVSDGAEVLFCGFTASLDQEAEATVAITTDHSYAAIFRIVGAEGYSIDKNDLTVTMGGEKLTKHPACEDCDILFYKKYTFGTALSHKLSFDLKGIGTLPEGVKAEYEFEEGFTTISELMDTDTMEALDNLKASVDGTEYLLDHWYVDDEEAENEWVSQQFLPSLTDDICLKASWVREEKATAADFEFEVPEPGTLVADFYLCLGADANNQLNIGLWRITEDKDGNTVLDYDAELEKGKQYYAWAYINTNKGCYIDQNNLPQISINGERTTLEHYSGDDDIIYYYVVFGFVPDKYFYDVILDFNYPDGVTKCVHSISAVPAGTVLSEGDFSILDALMVDVPALGNELSYADYENICTDHGTMDAEEFNGYYPPAEIAEQNGYEFNLGCYGKKRSYSSYDELMKDDDAVCNDKLKEDLTIYLQWKQEKESAELKSIEPPTCGQTRADYDLTIAEAAEFEAGITAGAFDLVDESEEHVSLSENTVFNGEKTYTFKITDPYWDDTYVDIEELRFNSYIGENTALKYQGYTYGPIYEEPNYTVYYIPVKAAHVRPEGTVPIKTKEVPAGCETAGSYVEEWHYHCEGCGNDVIVSENKVTAPTGHKWGVWKVVKEATEEEEGLEERVCENDESHKETRPIQKLQKQEENNPEENKQEEENKEEENKEDGKPDTEKQLVFTPKKESKINDADVSVEATVAYPKAVTWTGSKITKEQLAALSKDGVIAKVTATGLDKAIKDLNKEADLNKLFKVSIKIGKEKKVNSEGSFTVRISLDKKTLKKAKIKGNDKKALNELVKALNKEFSDKPYTFKIVPIDLGKAAEVTLWAGFRNNEIDLNEDGSIRKLKKLKIKVQVPGKKRDKQYFKTYTFKGAGKIKKSFKVVLTDKAGAKATVSALEKQNFEGSRSNVTIKN